MAATFFTLDGDGEIQSCIAHGADLPADELPQEVRTWKARLHGVDPLAPARIAGVAGRIATVGAVPETGSVRQTYERIGVINDVRLLIRDGERLVAGVTLWRPVRRSPWTPDQLRLLEALQPLVEMAYLSAVRTASSIDAGLPATLTGRQRQVARLLAIGATNPEIARALYVSPNTAKSHTRAVLSKLGVASRREIVMRFPPAGPERPPDVVPRSSREGPSEPPIRLEGDRAPQRLLAPVLDWSAGRMGGVVGGCAFFTARLERAVEAWGMARRDGLDADPRVAWRVHRRLLPPSASSEIVSYLEADSARSPVLQLDVSGPAPGDDLAELVGNLGLTPPLMTVLRTRGRITGLIWLCRDARAAPDQRESARLLLSLHPLLQLTHVTRLADDRGQVSTVDDLAERGLTPREIAVARLALAGEGNAAIARALRISESTVKKHMTHILAKCGVRSRTQLIALLSDEPNGG
jgi:DNA-binding NarL/FixJ family response regulator